MKANAIVSDRDVKFVTRDIIGTKVAQSDRDAAKLLFFEYAKALKYSAVQTLHSYFKYDDVMYSRIASFNTFEMAIAFYEMFGDDISKLRIMKWNAITFDVVCEVDWTPQTLLGAIKTWWKS